MANTKNTSETKTSRSSQEDDSAPERSDRSTRDTRRDEDDTVADRPSPMEVLRQARAQLAELTGMTAESVSSFAQTEDGWSLEVEVLELERVPDTMSLMASYEVELDPEGQLTGYRRVRRYERGRADAHRRG
ncbi:gas vesicle protein [Streptomyces sp. NPDC088254]|uniref:gas vesicle protein GvpO n=1 Tax=Streptomyces sp. NPDC088254 TaxID=3365847 RepID=UPI0037FE3590